MKKNLMCLCFTCRFLLVLCFLGLCMQVSAQVLVFIMYLDDFLRYYFNLKKCSEDLVCYFLMAELLFHIKLSQS